MLRRDTGRSSIEIFREIRPGFISGFFLFLKKADPLIVSRNNDVYFGRNGGI